MNSSSRAGARTFLDASTQAWTAAEDSDGGSEMNMREAKVREAATQFVASAFIMPVLAMRHESPFAAEPFAENSAQKRFAPMLDWQFADRIASASKFPLVDAIVERMMQQVDGGAGAREFESGIPHGMTEGTLDVSG